MAALNFPSSPILNQIFTANGKSWRYDGTSWKTFYVLGVPSGGTGNTSYNLGDVLVGAGTSMFALPIGSNGYVLTSDNTAPFLVSWQPTSATGVTTLNGLNVGLQYLATGTSGTEFNISSSGSTHTFNIPIAGSGATGLVSTLAQTFAGQKTFTSTIIGDLSGTATTAGFASTASYAHQSGYATTAGSADIWTTPRTLSLAGDLTGSIVWSGAGDTTLTALIAANSVALGVDTTGQYASTISISGSGISATTANGDDGTAYTIYSSATDSNVPSTIVFRDSSGNFSAGTITASLSGTATTATYAHQAGYAITAGTSSLATTATYAHQSGYAITSGSSATATTATYAHQAGYAVTSGFANTSANINIANATTNSAHYISFTPVASGSGVALSTNTTVSFNPSTFILSTSGLAVTSTTVSTSVSSGSLIVSGGVGIGGSLFLSTSNPSSLSGVVVNNGVIASGAWAGSTVTSFYGGTGFQSFTTGDLLVGAGSTLTKIALGSNNFILVADNTVAGGIKWANVSGIAITNINGLTASKQDLSFGYSGTVPAFASSGSTHTLNIPLASTGATGLVSTQTQSFAGIKTFTNAVNITDNTGSGTYTSGALVVTGGVGIGGTLNVQGDLNVQGTFTTINSTTITVADKNIELGVVASPSDITAQGGGITLKGATDKSINWYSGVGWSSSESFNLASGNTYKINGTNVLTNNTLGTGVIFSSIQTAGIITSGTWSATAITAYYGGTGYQSYTVGDLLVGAGSTLYKLSVGTNNYVLTADNTAPGGIKWTNVSGLAVTSLNGLTSSLQTFATGTSGSGFNISSSGSTHTFNIPIAGTGATGLVTTLAQSFAGVKTFTNDVIISSTTGSTAYNTGALTVYGGVGVSGQLSFNQAALGFTGAINPSMAFIGSTTSAPITLTVLSDNSLIYEGTSGKLFGINNNLSSGWIFNVGDISGLPILRANADGTIAMAEFTANVGIGLSNPSYKLHVVGDTNLSSGYVYRINGTSVLSATTLGTGVIFSSLQTAGIITSGTWSATAITSYYGGTGYQTYSTGDLLAGAGATLAKVALGTNNYVLIADNTVPGGIKWGSVSGLAITNVNGLTASKQDLAFGYTGTVPGFSSSGSTHTLNIPLAGSGSTGLISTQAQTIAGVKTFTSAIIGDLTGTATTAGFASTASYSYQSGYGITSGIATTAQNVSVANAITNAAHFLHFSPVATGSGVAVSSNTTISYNPSTFILSTSGLAVTASTVSTSTSTGALIVSGGVGIGQSVITSPSYASSISGVVHLNGVINSGAWAGSTITSYYGGTGFQTFTTGDILVGAGSTLSKIAVGANNYVLTADNTAPGGIKWAVTASTGVTTLNTLTALIQYFDIGTSGSGFNIASSGSTHTFNIPIAGTGATGLVSTLAQSFAGVKTFTNDTVISSSTVSTSSSTGALTITGGVGIGGSLFTGTSTPDSISGVVLNNGVITSGSWSATAITARYGGTGYTSYTLGDLLVGAGNTFVKLPVGINSYVLGADSSKPSGIGWTTVTPLTISDTAPASPKNADLWFNSLDGGLLVYYNDGDANQWVEIALGSGIDLSQPVHITNTTASTSTSTGALIVNGGAGFGSTIYAPVISINEIYDQISSTLTTSTTTADQVALAISSTIYRTLKIYVQITSSTSYHSQEIMLVHDGSVAYLTEYAIVNNGSILSTFDADISGGNVRLLVTPTNAVTTYKIACTGIRI